MDKKEVLKIIGEAWKEYGSIAKHPGGLAEDIRMFLNSLIPQEKPWSADELKEGDHYWVSDYDCVPYSSIWRNSLANKWHVATGNCHPTKEAAEAYYNRIMGKNN